MKKKKTAGPKAPSASASWQATLREARHQQAPSASAPQKATLREARLLLRMHTVPALLDLCKSLVVSRSDKKLAIELLDRMGEAPVGMPINVVASAAMGFAFEQVVIYLAHCLELRLQKKTAASRRPARKAA